MIITGERVINLCDCIITTRSLAKEYNLDELKVIYIENFIKSSLIPIMDFGFSANVIKIFTFTPLQRMENDKHIIKLFIFTDFVDLFSKFILPYLTDYYKYVIYIGNGDVSFRSFDILECSKIQRVYAQNPDVIHYKLRLLPIGIANSKWPHGDLKKLSEFFGVKTKSNMLYINLNHYTYSFRQNILEDARRLCLKTSSNLNYKEYLQELQSHYFCLCIRGNGLDTHRFWESLYLDVIPVIINDGTMDKFLKNLDLLSVPYVLLRSLDEVNILNENLYKEKINFNKSLLQLDTYKEEN